MVAQSILSGEAKAGEKALVIGGGLIGCETAEFLAAQGSDVTILELQPELAKDMESRTRRYLMQRLREYGTRFLTSTQVLEVTEEGKVKAKFPSGSERWLDDFDTLVIAVGYRAENALAAELEEMGCPCVRVGDWRLRRQNPDRHRVRFSGRVFHQVSARCGRTAPTGPQGPGEIS